MYAYVYMYMHDNFHKSRRDDQPLRYISRDGHANRGRDTPSFCSTGARYVLSAVSVLIVEKPSSEVPEGLMNYPIYIYMCVCVCVCVHSSQCRDAGRAKEKKMVISECRAPRRCFRVLLVSQPCCSRTVTTGSVAVLFMCYAGEVYRGYMFNINRR
jgi:hypothetical protein